MLKTAVIGASGYIGHHLLKKYRQNFPDCLGTTFSKQASDLKFFDIRSTDIETLELEEGGYESVVIAAAKPNISYCEKEPSKAYEVNVLATLNLIKKLGEMSIKIIFLSSDYVFDGVKGNFGDNHFALPSTVYGKHKETVEREILSLKYQVSVLRLSKIYGLEKGDNTILDEGANLLSQDKKILAATDQFFCPTFIDNLVEAIFTIQEIDLKGCLNVCSPEKWSRFEIFTKLASLMGKDEDLVKKIHLHDLPEMKGRPLDTSMVCDRLNNKIEINFLSLKDAMLKVAENYNKLKIRVEL
tara:strand:- start:1601 stop:2497 length:897 start_codon:yes stop_codon:yes gene_type:complete